MANEIKIANMSTPTDVVSAAISRALIRKVVCLPHVYAEDLPVGTVTKLARKDDALGLGDVVTEASNYTFSGSSDFAQTSVSLTVANTVIASKLTVQAEQFTDANDQMIINKQANSLQRTLDSNIKTLVSGFSNSITATNVLTVEDMMDAAYTIRAADAGPQGGQRCVAFIDFKGRNEITKQLVQTGASAFTNIELLSLLTGLNQDSLNGYVGNLPGIDVYEVGDLPTASGATKRVSLVFNPELAFFGMYGSVQVLRKAPDSQGLFTELTSYVFSQVAEWNDVAGCRVISNV